MKKTLALLALPLALAACSSSEPAAVDNLGAFWDAMPVEERAAVCQTMDLTGSRNFAAEMTPGLAEKHGSDLTEEDVRAFFEEACE